MRATNLAVQDISEQILGGYENARGEISLFGEALAFRINFKNQTVRERPKLNAEAQARYDAAECGEAFQYCSKQFRRLSDDQIADICCSGTFRMTPRI
jgi:hypothetical protein